MRYESPTKPAALQTILVLVLTSIALVPIFYIQRASIGKFMPFVILSGISYLALISIFIISSLRSRTPFLCEITADSLIYTAPSCSGTSFNIPLNEIIDVFTTETDGFFIRTKDSQEYWISDHFGNPTHLFYAKLRTLTLRP